MEDVEDDAYQGFDADGRSFVVEAITREGRPHLFGLLRSTEGELRVTLRDAPPQPDRLRALLMNALLAVDWGTREQLEALSLADLQAAAVETYGVE